jgi:hypothetical protein
VPVRVRALRQPIGVPVRTLVARPLLGLGRFTLDTLGAPLAQASVQGFSTLTDALLARDISTTQGHYFISTPFATPLYVVAIQDGTIDTMVVTIDNNLVTIDRMTSIGGVSANNLVGTS